MFAQRTLMKVNCAALAPRLIEGELFGRENIEDKDAHASREEED